MLTQPALWNSKSHQTKMISVNREKKEMNIFCVGGESSFFWSGGVVLEVFWVKKPKHHWWQTDHKSRQTRAANLLAVPFHKDSTQLDSASPSDHESIEDSLSIQSMWRSPIAAATRVSMKVSTVIESTWHSPYILYMESRVTYLLVSAPIICAIYFYLKVTS